jgi:PIN domain nuclease of toxin-antitoxin system
MNYLLDTHTFLWFVSNSRELSQKAKQLMEDDTSNLFLSIASIWEIGIKNSLGKLDVKGGFDTIPNDLKANDIEVMFIEFGYVSLVNKLPFYHRDPFDRIIIAHALAENMDIIGKDTDFDNYLIGKPIKRIW